MDILNLLNSHKSVRAYADKDISEDLLDELINASCRASNTGNMQLYSIIATRDKQLKEKLAPCHFNQKMVTEAPVVLTFCADLNRFEKWCDQRNAQHGYDNFQSFYWATIDAILAAQNFCIAAESRGLGICFLGTTTYLTKEIIEVLNIPKHVVPVTTVTVGYPKDDNAPLSDRLPVEGVLHKETYHDYTTADIERIYAPKEALPENQNFVKINNKENLAQIFTDIRYKKEDNELFSERLLNTLKEQGIF